MSNDAPKRKGLFFGIRLKMLLPIMLMITLILALAFYWLYSTFTRLVTEGLHADLEAVIEAVAPQIDGDALISLYEDYAYQKGDESQPWPPGMTEDERFIEIADIFTQAATYSPRAYPFVYVSPEPGVIVHVVDSLALENPEWGYWFGESQEVGEGEYDLYEDDVFILGLQETTYDLTPVRDEEDGWIWVYAATPIRDSEGRSLGALAVEVAASDVVENQSNIRTFLLPTCCSTYLILLVAVLLIANSITAPIRRLRKAAERIGEGQYDPIDVKPGLLYDEVSVLTWTFNTMVEKVRGREEKLKQQVEELRIMIDQDKRKRQVEQITDTGFFQDLQDRARQMRGRGQEDEQG